MRKTSTHAGKAMDKQSKYVMCFLTELELSIFSALYLIWGKAAIVSLASVKQWTTEFLIDNKLKVPRTLTVIWQN